MNDAQLGQIRMGMGMTTGFKRPRGRPRIDNPNNHRGSIRGARQGTIDLFKTTCREKNKDPGDVLEELLRKAIEEMAGPEALKQIIQELEAEKLQQEARIQKYKEKLAKLLEAQSRGPPDGVPFDEALERAATMLSGPENRADYLGMLEPNARKLAVDYPGNHWQNIKRDLKKLVEDKLDVMINRVKAGE